MVYEEFVNELTGGQNYNLLKFNKQCKMFSVMTTIFVKIESIRGESLYEDYRDWIQVFEVRWALRQEAHHHGQGGPGFGAPQFDALSIVKQPDMSSVPIAMAAVQCKRLDEVKLEWCLVLEKSLRCYSRIRLRDVLVSKVESRTLSGDGAIPHSGEARETVDLNFGEIKWEYFDYGPDNRKRGSYAGGWCLRRMLALA